MNFISLEQDPQLSLKQAFAELYEATGWTEQRIARELGVSQGTAHRLKHGKGNTSFDVGVKLLALRDGKCAGISSADHGRVAVLRASLPYINAHQGKIFLLWLPYEVFASPALEGIVCDIALLSSMGARLVIVYGCYSRTDPSAPKNSTEATARQRVFSEDQLQDMLKRAEILASRLIAKFSVNMPNSPLIGSSIKLVRGNFVVSRPSGIINGIDLQRSGELRRVDRQGLCQLLECGSIVLLPPYGYSSSGEIFALCDDDLSVSVASALDADKWIAFCSDAAVRDHSGALIREVALGEQDERLDQSQLPAAWFFACHAVERGVLRAHLVSYLENGSLLRELFTRDGAGTMLSQQPYERLRAAIPEDISAILAILAAPQQLGELVGRSSETLENEIDHFWVLERDGLVIACASLRVYLDSACAEVACVATHPDYRGSGRAQRMLKEAERRAAAMRLQWIFALSTQAGQWFVERGYEQGDLSRLPPAREYDASRASRLYIKSLS